MIPISRFAKVPADFCTAYLIGHNPSHQSQTRLLHTVILYAKYRATVVVSTAFDMERSGPTPTSRRTIPSKTSCTGIKVSTSES